MGDSFVKKLSKVLTSKNSLKGATSFLALTLLISNILGLLRNVVLASRFSPSELDIYFAAFQIPNLIFNLLVFGAITTAFIPVFSELIVNEKNDESWKLTANLFNLVTILLISLSIILSIFMPKLIIIVVPGFDSDRLNEAIILSRIMFLQAIIFGWSYITIMPVVVSDVFHKGATFLGYFYSVSGIGAVFGAILISILFKKVEPKKIIIIGNIIFVVSLISFTFTTNLFLALFFLFLTGFGLIVQVSTTNNLIQQNVNDGMRGRIMSIYSFMFAGMAPIGNFQIGFFSENFGSLMAIRMGAIALFLTGLILFLNKMRNQKDNFSSKVFEKQ